MIRRGRSRHLVLLVGTCGAFLGAACARAPSAGDVSVTWAAEPTPPVVNAPMIAEVTLLDATGKPVHGATLEIEGHMSHPGMAPVLATAEERRDGVYAVRLQFPMAGDWIVLVKGSLPDGRTLNHRIDIANVRPSG